MKKTFVIDTNVLLIDPEALFRFPKSHVVLPVTVLEELDKMKRLSNDLGKNARSVFRILDACSSCRPGNLHTGVILENEADLRIALEPSKEENCGISLNINDNRIIMIAYLLKKRGENVVFVSKDFAARLKAEAIGLEAEDYENEKFSYTSLYKGVSSLELPKYEIDLFLKNGSLQLPPGNYHPNQYFILSCPERSSAIGKWNPVENRLEPLLKSSSLWGVKPRNPEQRCCVDLLLREDIKLVTLVGQAGTGKTLLALACGMRKVFDEGVYSRILITRPIVPLGRDIGYLPGTKEEKLHPWMQPIFDNLEFLCSSSASDGAETVRYVMESKKIEMEAVTYIRGRSLPRAYMIIDEAQNLTPEQVKGIASRAGEGTKVIFTGDPTQIDNPYLSDSFNGLTYLVAKCSQYKLFGHIFLEKTERSELAALAAAVL